MLGKVIIILRIYGISNILYKHLIIKCTKYVLFIDDPYLYAWI